MKLLQEMHEGTGGHFSRKKTLHRIERWYYWETLNKDLTEFVKTCEVCQKTKTSTQKPYGMLNPIEPPKDKFQEYSMDFITGLPRTKKGKDAIMVVKVKPGSSPGSGEL